jgi:flavodoxin
MCMQQVLQKPWAGIMCLIIIALTVFPAYAQEDASMKILIVYYSRTGNTKLACEALAKELGADLLEIKDGADRSGGWGFFTGAMSALFNMQTSIEPEHPNLAPYSRIILAAPIWSGRLATAARTLIAKNRFDGKKVALFTTTNVLEKEASREKGKAAVAGAGGIAVGYWQVAVREKIDGKKIEKTPGQIVKDALSLVPDIKAAFEKAR